LLSPHEERVCGLLAARAAAMRADLERFVAIPTGGGHAPGLDALRGLLTARLAALGAAIQLVPGAPRPDWLYSPASARGAASDSPSTPASVARRDSGGRGRPLLLVGHLDTVHDPRGPFQALTPAPDGATAIGPGCADMKGGIVVALHALEALAEAGLDLDWTFVLNSDEESGSYHSEPVLRHEAGRLVPRRGAGLVFEPAAEGGALVVERGGSGQFLLDVRGRAAHVGRDFFDGVSAVQALAQFILAAERLSDRQRGLIVNIGPLEGSEATNVVPPRARAWGNVRFPGPAEARELREKLEALATPGPAPGAPPAEPPVVRVLTSFIRPAKPLSDPTRRLAELARHVALSLGQALPFTRTGGVCDGNILQDAGLACIDTLGVRGGGLHTEREWVDLPSLVERAKLAALVMLRAAAADEP